MSVIEILELSNFSLQYDLSHVMIFVHGVKDRNYDAIICISKQNLYFDKA